MKYQVNRVRGAQAEMALRDLGLVKITESSARDLFDLGVPLVVAPSKVNSFHFWKGWSLAMQLDSQRYHREGVPFERFRNSYNAHADAETGNAAFFVDKSHVVGTTPAAQRKQHRARYGY